MPVTTFFKRLRRTFGSERAEEPVKVEPLPVVNVGEEYRLRSQFDPWPPKIVTTVIDVKDGWVRYRIGHVGALFGDERKPLAEFLDLYVLHKP